MKGPERDALAGREAALDDARLVREALAGESAAFDELVERYQGKIYGLATSLTGNPHDGMDATQNAFLKAYQNLERFDPAHKFFSWIYRIGLNEALNIVHRRPSEGPPEEETVETAPGPERRAASREAGGAIRQAVAELSADLRVAIVLRHFHGLTYREMGAVLEIPEKRVKSRLFEARSRLRRRLIEKGLGPET